MGYILRITLLINVFFMRTILQNFRKTRNNKTTFNKW